MKKTTGADKKAWLAEENKNLKMEISILRDGYFQLKKTARKLLQSEERFRTFFENEPSYCYMVSLDEKILNVNKAAFKALDYKKEELIGKPLKMIYGPESWEKAQKLFKKWRKTGELLNEEIDIITKHGEKRTVLLSADTAKDQSGRVLHSVSIQIDITERKRAQEALQKNVSLLNEAERITHTGSWHLDSVNDVLSWSDEIYRIFEIDQKKFSATHEAVLDAIHPEDRELVNKAHTDSVKNKTPHEIVYRLLLSGEKIKYVRERCGTYYDKVGKPIESVGTVQDITDLRLGEIKQEQLLYDLGERMKELNMVYLVSHVLESDIDIDKGLKQIVDKIPFAYQFPRLACARITYGGKHFQTSNFKKTTWGQTAGIDFGKGKIGSVEVYYSKKSPFLVEEERMINEVASQVGNIIERRLAVQELEKTAIYLDAMGDALMVLDVQMKVVRLNKAAMELWGYAEKDIPKLSFQKTFPKKEHAKHKKTMERAVKEKTAISFETVIITKGGKEIPVAFTATVLANEQGRPAGFVGVFRDITERKKVEIEKRAAEEQVRSLDKLKSRFITALTHVVRTPLNEIRWGIEALLSGDLGELSKEQSSFLHRTLESEQNILNLVTNMNTVLDIERDTLFYEKSSTSMVSLVKSVVEDFSTECKLRGLTCIVKVPTATYPSMLVDSKKMRLIFGLLYDNAIRYTPTQKKVTVRFSKTKTHTIVKIIDGGIGIPKEEQASIFERFFRASNAQSMHVDGVGLGLYIAKAVVEAHGGEIGFESVEREGSTFWVKLPIEG